MTICGSQSCACALTSTTLSITGSGTPASPWVLEQAEFSDITQLQVDVDSLEASMAVALGNITTLQTQMGTAQTDITRLDAYQFQSDTQTTGTTSGTTALTIVSATFTTVPVAGTLYVDVRCLYTKTVTTDLFTLTCRINGAGQATGGQDRSGAAAGWATAAGGPAAISAATAPSVDGQLTRSTGTGTATVSSASLRAWFVPN